MSIETTAALFKGLAALVATFGLILILGKWNKPTDSVMRGLIRLLYAFAGFWWCFAVAVEAGYKRFQEEQVNVKAQIGVSA